MRLDDYRCSDCGNTFEALLESDEKAHCPSCAGEHTVRELSGFAIGGSASSSITSGGTNTASYGGCANGMCGC